MTSDLNSHFDKEPVDISLEDKFNLVRKHVHTLNLFSGSSYWGAWDEGLIPRWFPKRLECSRRYKDYFKGWPHFCGYEGAKCRHVPRINRASYQTFKKTFRKRLDISSAIEYYTWARGDSYESRFPKRPSLYYKEEWEGWDVALGKHFGRGWREFNKLKAFIRVREIKSLAEYKRLFDSTLNYIIILKVL